MAVTVITPERLKFNAFSANLPEAGGGSANSIVPTTAADGWSITNVMQEDHLVIRLTAGATETFVFKAGDRPPSQRADLGDLTITMTSGQSRYISIEAARFMKKDGTITVTCASTSSVLAAVITPYTAQRG